MAKLPKIWLGHGNSGYVLIYAVDAGTIFDLVGGSLVSYNASHYASKYALTLTEEDGASGIFTEDAPAALPAGTYSLLYFIGASPAENDNCIGQKEFDWDGAASITLDSIHAALDDVDGALTAGVSVAAIGNNVITAAAINTGALTAAKFAADSITASAAAADFGQEIADALLSRSVATVEGSAPEHCLATIILMMLEFEILSDTVARIYRSNGSTTHYNKAITISTDAKPIVKVA